MSNQKQDAFARAVEQMHPRETRMHIPLGEHRYIAETLLRRQHRAIERLVRRQVTYESQYLEQRQGKHKTWHRYARVVLIDLLEALRRRR